MENKKRTVDLSVIDGTLANTISENSNALNVICLDPASSLDDKKVQLITLLKENTKETPYVKNVIKKIYNFRDGVSLLSYMYNLTLAGSGMYSY